MEIFKIPVCKILLLGILNQKLMSANGSDFFSLYNAERKFTKFHGNGTVAGRSRDGNGNVRKTKDQLYIIKQARAQILIMQSNDYNNYTEIKIKINNNLNYNAMTCRIICLPYSNNYDFVPFALPSRYRPVTVTLPSRYRPVTVYSPSLRTVTVFFKWLQTVTLRHGP